MERYLVPTQARAPAKNTSKAAAGKENSGQDDPSDNERPTKKIRHSSSSRASTSRPSLQAVLNSFSLNSRDFLYRTMKSSAGGLVKVKTHINGDLDQQQVASLRGGCLESGSAWVDFATCEIIDGWGAGGNSGDHPRWQPVLLGDKGKLGGIQSTGNKIKSGLQAREWNDLLSVYLNSGESKKVQPKITCHHVSYAASPQFTTTPLPLNLGAGSSISHHCDQQGCISQNHIFVTEDHIDNCVRQRCIGVILVVFNGIILLERPCLHGGTAGTVKDRLLLSCRKLLVLEMSLEAANLVVGQLSSG